MLPTVCLLCEAPAGRTANLCDGCARELARMPLEARLERAGAGPRVRGVRVLAAFAYRPPLSELVHAAKFHGSLAAAHTLGRLLADWLAEAGGALPDALLPVPLHASRLRTRGFNQSAEIARPVARRLGVPVLLGHCQRVRATPPQSSRADARERRANLADAFAVGERLERLSAVAIVDDVVTTGVTGSELARVIRRAGVRRVEVWACARVI